MGSKRKHPSGPAPSPAQKRPKSDGASKPKNAAQQQAKLLADRRPFVQDLKPEDHERERSLYKLLGSPDREDRIDAGNAIVTCLLGGDSGEDSVPEPVLRRHLERRLCRGLASSNEAARVGFSYVLVEIVRQLIGEKNLAAEKYPGLDFDALLEILVEKTTTSGKMPGQEERDHYVGRLFGLRSFVLAGVLYKNEQRWDAVLKLLLQLAQKKVWLRQQCGFVLAQAVPKLKRKLAEKTLQELSNAGLAKSPDGLSVWIAAMGHFEDKTMPKPWPEPLGSKSLQDVAAVLKGSNIEMEDDGGVATKQANGATQVHFAWDLILAHFLKKGHAKDFKLFWDRVVDQSCYSKSASPHQKAAGFRIFQKVLETCTSSPAIVQSIFSQHLMGCLMNQASSDERNLHRAALKSLKAIETAVEQNPELILKVLNNLLGDHGAYNFDERTSSKTVEKLLRLTRPDDAQSVLSLLETTVKGTSVDDDSGKHLRIYADYVSKLVTVGVDSKDQAESQPNVSSVGAVALAELAKLAYSSPTESGLTEQTKVTLRGRLASSFAKVIRRPEDFPYLCNAILAVEPNAIEMDDEIQSELFDALKRLQKLVKLDQNGSVVLQMPRQGLALLHAIAILQLYNEEPDALEVLGDTRQCYEKLRQKEKQKASRGGAAADAGMSEFLVEILLSMVAQPSSLMRQASLLVFESFTPLMSAEALELLTDTLVAEENAEGQKALFNTADEDEMDVDDDDDDGDEDGLSNIGSDVEFVGIENIDNGNVDDDTGSGSESENSDGEDGDSDNGLAEILGTHRLDKDAEAEAGDDDDDDNADMTDSEMMALDEKMAEYFRHRVKKNSKRKDKKNAKESVVNFKHRVLDLLAVYTKKEAAGDNALLAFGLLLPLLRHARTTSNKALASKACTIVLDFSKHRKKATKKSKSKSSSENYINVDELVARLEEIHGEASADPSHAFAKAVSSASLAIASALFAIDKGNFVRVDEVYGRSRLAFVLDGLRIQPSFFIDWVNWYQSLAQQAQAQAQAQAEA